MIGNAETLEIIAYLKTAPNKFVSMLEISRRAAGRRRFEESPNWAKNLMHPLIEAGIVEVNARGHYRFLMNIQPESKPEAARSASFQVELKSRSKVVGDDYFPASEALRIVGGDYFPVSN